MIMYTVTNKYFGVLFKRGELGEKCTEIGVRELIRIRQTVKFCRSCLPEFWVDLH